MQQDLFQGGNMLPFIARTTWPIRLRIALSLGLMFALSSTILAFADVKLIQLSSDPFTNSTSQHQTEVEPDTFAFGSTLVSAFQVGRYFAGGASGIGFATSTNGGTSFTKGFLPATTPFSAPPSSTHLRASDPSVAFDAKHGVWLISFTDLAVAPAPGGKPIIDVLLSRSTDGLTWSNPVLVEADGHFNDKDWIVCDNTASSPGYGNCYIEFDDNSIADLILMSTSRDGGRTWGAALPTADHGHGLGGQPLVQPNGTVIVPLEGFAGPHEDIVSFSSTDGGASWSRVTKIAAVRFHAPAGTIRADILPSAEIDASGNVYVVWPDCHFEAGCVANDLVFSTSSDGNTWSRVTRIPLDPIGSGVDHFIPGLAVDPSTSGGGTHLVVTFYYYPVANCTSATCQLEVGTSTSADGGASWTSNTRLAGPMSLSWLANTSLGVMVGDYISTSFVGGPAFAVFAVAQAPNGSTFNEAIYTVSGGERVGGSPQLANDRFAAGSNATLTGSSLTAW